MPQNPAIISAFADSATPFLIVANDKIYTIIAANNAFCTWLGCGQVELLQKPLFRSSDRLLKLLNLSELQLSGVFEEVLTSKAAVKGNIKIKLEKTDSVASAQFNGGYEVFPVIENNEVVYLVMQVLAVKRSISLNASVENSPVQKADPNQPLELLIDNLSNVIFTLDVEAPGIYRFSFVNYAFQTTTGLPVDKVIGKYVHEVIPEPSLSMVLEKYKEVIEKKQEVRWEEMSHYPAGQKIGEVLVIPILNDQGECFRLIGMVHDITPFKEAEAKQERLAQDLYQQNRDLQQFTYIISHNLRAPLANALGLVRHLPKIPPATDNFKQYIEYVTISIEALDKILTDLNQILSIRDRQDLAVLEPVSLADICKQAEKMLESELEQAGGQLNINIDPNFKVNATRAYLYSICYNLISNAIKYRCSERPLLINVTSDISREEGPAIHFTDNGSGIDMEKVGHNLFKLYTRFHDHVDGRGIGLFLVKTHLEALGGHIKVESEPNKGTTFSVFFRELVK